MAKRTRQTRQQAERRGRLSEHAAALLLRLKGYQILAERVRTPVGEVDLIARRGSTLCFVEVKQRKTTELAQTSVPQKNWMRIASAAATWASKNQDHSALNWRYDLVAVSPRYWPTHFKDYWRP